MSTVRVLIEETITQQAEVDMVIDDAEYDEWLGNQRDTPETRLEFIKSSADYPENLPEPWKWTRADAEQDVITVVAR